MPVAFGYKVRDRTGNLVEGQLEADSMALVAARLREMGYTPISIEPRSNVTLNKEISIPILSSRIKLKELAVASRQFATMINSGLTLVRSLGILADQCECPPLATILREVQLDVEQGLALSDALAKHPKAFSRLYVAMVRAGEVGGTLDSTLLLLADTIEKQVELRRRIRSAMSYPVFATVFIGVIFSVMMVFVVPVFKKMYHQLGGQLPPPTRALIAVSDAVAHWFYIFIIVIGLAVFGLWRWVHTEKGRDQFDRFMLRVPVFGKLVHKTALARFARTLASLVRTGVPILESLDIVAATCGNTVVAEATHSARAGVQMGEAISRPLMEHPVFPPMVVQMIAVGEQTGALDTMLNKIADFYESEVAAMVDALTSLIEPILIVIMGAAVGAIVITLYLPMFDIYNLIK